MEIVSQHGLCHILEDLMKIMRRFLPEAGRFVLLMVFVIAKLLVVEGRWDGCCLKWYCEWLY